MLSEELMHKAVCLIRKWGGFNCTDSSWIPFSPVRANVVCAVFYPGDGEFPCDTEIVLEIWDVSSKLRGNCDHHNGMWPKLQLPASCRGSSSWAESHSTLDLCCCLPPAWHKVEGGAQTGPDSNALLLIRAVILQKVWNTALSWYLLVLFFWKAALSSPWQWSWVLWVLGSVIQKAVWQASPVCITTWLSFGGKRVHPLLTLRPSKLLPGTHSFKMSVFRISPVHWFPKPSFTFTGIFCLHRTPRAVGKGFNKWIEFIPFRNRKQHTEFNAKNPLVLHHCIWVYLTEYGVVISGWDKLAVSSLLFVFAILTRHLHFRKDVIMVDG